MNFSKISVIFLLVYLSSFFSFSLLYFVFFFFFFFTASISYNSDGVLLYFHKTKRMFFKRPCFFFLLPVDLTQLHSFKLLYIELLLKHCFTLNLFKISPFKIKFIRQYGAKKEHLFSIIWNHFIKLTTLKKCF